MSDQNKGMGEVMRIKDALKREGSALLDLTGTEAVALPLGDERRQYVAVGTPACIAQLLPKAGPGVEQAALTDNRIYSLADASLLDAENLSSVADFARAIERDVIARLAATTQASTAQAEPKAWSASEALLYAARVVELYDDATMQGDYMIDSKDCAAILTAMASMPMLTATSSTDAQAAAEVRVATLEEAAAICDRRAEKERDIPGRRSMVAVECAAAIRARKRAGDTGAGAAGEKGGAK